MHWRLPVHVRCKAALTFTSGEMIAMRHHCARRSSILKAVPVFIVGHHTAQQGLCVWYELHKPVEQREGNNLKEADLPATRSGQLTVGWDPSRHD